MKHDHWLRCEHRQKPICFAIAFVGTRITYGPPYAMAIVRRRGLQDVRRFHLYAERHGFTCTVLRGHDGPCMLADWGPS